MDLSKLKRKPEVTKECVLEMDGKLLAKDKCYIVVPFRFLQAGLLEFGQVTTIATIFPIVNDKGEYSVVNICGKMEISSNNIQITDHTEGEQYVFGFDKGDIITPDINLVMDDNFSYKIYSELIQKAKSPWFLNYEDIGKIMATSKSHSGVNLASTNSIFEIIVSTLSRGEDMKTHYRMLVDDLNLTTLNKNKLETIPLNSVIYATGNKMNKLMGGYLEDGLTSALTETKSSKSGVELLLRKE